ncbi:circularly permuted type 2 ATP-grasp protein, partial [Acinetobacter baumannii]
DVIYRRVDGAYCDPLELRDDSALGITGLLQAQRAGNVAVVNDPGAALVETPALLPFLPGLAERLLGAELELPAVTAWWCGQH